MRTNPHAPPVSLAIGPANFAGQAYQWAHAVRDFLGVDTRSFAPVTRGFEFPVDVSLGRSRADALFRRHRAVARALEGASHVAVDGFIPLFGIPGMGNLRRDVDRLARRGVRVALISHGSDTRDPDAHIARNQYSYFSSAGKEYVARLRTVSRTNREFASDSGLPVFVSTPDLLLDNPGASWLPLSVQSDRWRGFGRALASDVPTVLHIPSKRLPPIKGTATIDPVLRSLDERGKIVYLSAERVSNVRMAALVERCDIVVDQLLSGSYGVAAIEGMASGRLVVGNVAAATRSLMSEPPPIVDATPDDFEAIVMDILAHREFFFDLAATGPGFVDRWHSGAASAAALSDFLLGSQ